MHSKTSQHNHTHGVMEGRYLAWRMSGIHRILHEMFSPGNLRRRIFQLLNLHGHETVVDSGCGSGFYSVALAKRLKEGKVIAVDLSHSMLAALKRRVKRRRLGNRIEIRHGDSADLPLEDSLADAGLCVAVLHHLEDPARAVRELHRVLKPGGRVVIVDWFVTEEGHRKGRHRRRRHHIHERPFGSAEMNHLLVEAGLVEIEIERLGKWVIGRGYKE